MNPSSRRWWPVALLLVFCGMIVFSATADETKGQARKQCRQYLRQVRAHMESDRPDSALVYSSLARGCDPGHPDPYWYGAHAHLSFDDVAAARLLLEKGVEAAPLSKRLSLFLGRLCVDAGDYDQATELIDKVLLVHKINPEALYLRGRIQIAQGDSLGAMESWQAALQEAMKTEESQ